MALIIITIFAKKPIYISNLCYKPDDDSQVFTIESTCKL